MYDRKYHVRLHRVESNHNNLCTDAVEGEAYGLPQVGNLFTMVGAPLDPTLLKRADAYRLIRTTEIKKVETVSTHKLLDGTERPDEMLFETANSTYRLEVFEVISDEGV